MKNPIEVVRVDQRTKNLLIQLKRKTKIQNWNILCRWGFILSLTIETPPNEVAVENDGAVEMSWKVFSGSYDHLIWAMLKYRILKEGFNLDDDVLKDQFKRHLYRGIQHLSNVEFGSGAINFAQKIIPQEMLIDDEPQFNLFNRGEA